jgi:hypothetical protein
MRSAFGEAIVSPLAELRGGLVPGGEALWKKAQAILGAAPRLDADASRWLRRQGMTQARARVAKLVAEEDDRRVQTWMRVTLGGERMNDLASSATVTPAASFADAELGARPRRPLPRPRRSAPTARSSAMTAMANVLCSDNLVNPAESEL